MVAAPSSRSPTPSSTDNDELPDYAEMLFARHRAHAAELRALVGKMPVAEGDRVADFGCGDGAWSCWLSERVGDRGEVIAIDRNEGYLKIAARRTGNEVTTMQADAVDIPVPSASLDVAFCAHSLYAMEDPDALLREMRRVVRPGGSLCLVTADVLRHVQLPWPPELELTVTIALHEALSARGDGRPFLPRLTPEALGALGLRNIRHEVSNTTRRGPLGDDDRLYLRHWLGVLIKTAGEHLDEDAAADVRRWASPTAVVSDTFFVTFSDQLTLGTVC